MNSIVKNYYNDNAELEWNRLGNPYTNIEFRSSMYLIEKYFPETGYILDIGSGPGRYSLELLKKGYKLSLLDISNNELDIARDKIKEAGLSSEGYHCKSALELDSFEDESFDGILLMGPLYHLHEEKDRMKVLKDTYRILKKDGVGLISYINTWGALKAGVSEFPEIFENIEYFQKYVNGDLKLSCLEGFTESYFTIPSLALAEVKKAGFKIVSYAGVESFLSGLKAQINELYKNMPEVYENFMASAVKCCEMPQYRDATEHIHIIVKKR
ncbi:class I SAM-dependent methyltransferase [Vallitalea longa]|nr:class I SAM-dependent methyltransferase [Vallitalea longa]